MKENKFSEHQIWRWAYEIWLGVKYLHEKSILHRDIKSLNIFLTKTNRVKIGDLGISKILSGSIKYQATKVGTPLYLSPEQVKQKPYDLKVDIWGIGWWLYHISRFWPPFNGDNLIVLGNNIISQNPERLPRVYYSDKLNSFILSLLNKNKNERPNAIQTLLYFPNEIIKSYSDDWNLKLWSLSEEVLCDIDTKLKAQFDNEKTPIEDYKSIIQKNELSPKSIITFKNESFINPCKNPQQWDDVSESIWEVVEVRFKNNTKLNHHDKIK